MIGEPYPSRLAQAYPVSAWVNGVKNDDWALMEPAVWAGLQKLPVCIPA
jgi:hypothetical protein